MAAKDDGMVQVELTPDVQAMIVVLTTHALGAAREALQTLSGEGYTITRKHLERVTAALRPREFCQAALILGCDPAITNEQLIEAARASGAQAVREAGPFLRTVN